jgi:hypothetical protein
MIKISGGQFGGLEIPQATVEPMEQQAARAMAAAKLMDMVREWRILGIELGALHGDGAVADLLRDFGLGAGPRQGHAVSHDLPPPAGKPLVSLDRLDYPKVGPPQKWPKPSIFKPNGNDYKMASTVLDSAAAAPQLAPLKTNCAMNGGARWQTSIMPDGSSVSTGEGWRNGTYQIFTSHKDTAAETKTITVIVTPSGQAALFTDIFDNNNIQTTAIGDQEVIDTEQNRRQSSDPNEFDKTPPTGGKQTPGDYEDWDLSSPAWAHFNPYTGDYWGPVTTV